jgi:hypothetical protein
VIAFLNRYFVSVYVDDKALNDPAAHFEGREKAEVELWQRLWPAEQAQGAMYAPRMTVYAADGSILACIDTGSMIKRELMPRLQALAARSAQDVGNLPHVDSPIPSSDGRNLVLQVNSRFLATPEEIDRAEHAVYDEINPQPGYRLPPRDENLKHFFTAPSVDWVTLSPDQWHRLVDGGGASEWSVDPGVTARLMSLVEPPNLKDPNDYYVPPIHSMSLRAERLAPGRIRLLGDIHRSHPWWDARDDEIAEATVVGFVDYDRAQDRITSFRLATRDGSYHGGLIRPHLNVRFGVSLVMTRPE